MEEKELHKKRINGQRHAWAVCAHTELKVGAGNAPKSQVGDTSANYKGSATIIRGGGAPENAP